jgi:hypothetical protein
VVGSKIGNENERLAGPLLLVVRTGQLKKKSPANTRGALDGETFGAPDQPRPASMIACASRFGFEKQS